MHRFFMIWQLLSQKQKHLSIVFLLLMFLGTILDVVGIGLVVPLVGLMASPVSLYKQFPWLPFENLLSSYNQEQTVYIILGIMVGIYLFKTVYLSLLAWMQADFLLKVQANISKRLLRSYLRKKQEVFQNTHTSHYIQTTSKETEILIQQGYGATAEIIMNGLLLLSATTILLIAEPISTLIILIAIALSAWVFLEISKIRVYRWGKIRKVHEALRLKVLQQALFSAKEIKLTNKADYFINKFHTHSLNLVHSGRWQSTFRKVPKYFFEFLAIIGLSISIIYLVLRGVDLANIAPIIALFAAVFVKIMPSVNSIITGFHSLRYINETITLIHSEIFRNSAWVKENYSTKNKPIKSINFIDVSFGYKGTDNDLLKNITFEITNGSSIGIIGPSGSGKSTLVNLFLGLFIPDNGSIHLNGKNIHTNITSWQNRIGYVPQTIYLLDDTLRRNIAFGEEDNKICEDKVLIAIRKAELGNFVTNLTNGVDTVIGEDGGFISGGEKQRIALARALYRSPDILVLDEATSALDTHTEENILRTVYALQKDIIILIVTHRPATIERCESLIELQHGKIKFLKGFKK